MPALDHETIKSALEAQPLFEDKSWRLSPQAWPLTPVQVAELESIGTACLEFHQALETLYLRSATSKNLLRNKPLLAPWVADYLDRGKPANLVRHARDPKNRGAFPTVLRPDLLLTEDGFALTEMDSVPGGIGLTAFLNRLYGSDRDAAMLGHKDAMIEGFYQSLATLRPTERNPLIALLVSDEAATYRPEMQWLAEQLQRHGRRVYCLRPEEIFPLGGELFFDIEGTPERVEIIYRFFELFDWDNLSALPHILEAWEQGQVSLAAPLRHFQEEKLALALFHHHLLGDFWQERLSQRSLELLRKLIPLSWIMDPAPLPPGAVMDGPRVGGRMLNDWRDLAGASQKERDLIIKISGFHETAWGARSVVLGSDCSREEWQQGVEQALRLAPQNLHLLQEYRKPRRLEHPVFSVRADAVLPVAEPQSGRLRLCPYYFVTRGEAKLAGALATFCPADKKIIHGMEDAALLPCRIST
ncbi:MAG: hypothetical protein Q8M02_08600 [Candidatus Didemnitutus sp.]|nr:hypothetical protein [Candidatus Didemnitutus sp.]